MTTKRAGVLDRYFYLFMSLLIALVVVYGFHYTVGKRLFHPSVRPPSILYLHGSVFFGWLLFYILQSTLVRTRNVRLHRQIGWFGVALGCSMLVLGVSTAITMTRYDSMHLGVPDAVAFLAVPLWDITAFSTAFALAIYWRKKPEFHRRLMLLATCALTAAAFGRMPFWPFTTNYFYVGVDLLVLLGVARDLVVNRRVHPVYLYGLPAFLLGQAITVYTWTHNPHYWQTISHAILS